MALIDTDLVTSPEATARDTASPETAEPGTHTAPNGGETVFTWDYERSRERLGKLYEKAKTSQWNANDLPWHTEVDQEGQAARVAERDMATGRFRHYAEVKGSTIALWGAKEWTEFGVQSQNYSLSQFLHGEQGALVCTSKIVEQVPWIDAKYYGATQVMDEARHVEVFARYLNEKLSGHFPINPALQDLLDDVLADDRWDMTYLGMQIIIEGLALAAFGYMRQMTNEPLLAELLKYVMADEARHVAFGVLSLEEIYNEMSQAEIRERQEFAHEGVVRMQTRFRQGMVFRRMGVPDAEVDHFLSLRTPDQEHMFQLMLFAKIVPNCKKLGLLDAGDGWLRDRFTDLGIIEFEHEAATSDEYESLDAVSIEGAPGAA